jgi:hypothetical protein
MVTTGLTLCIVHHIFLLIIIPCTNMDSYQDSKRADKSWGLQVTNGDDDNRGGGGD